jgi:hypothetical protein
MSDSNVENTNSGGNKNGETSTSDQKPSLTTLTHKLKAEALRRYKLNDELDIESEGPSDLESSNQDAKVDTNELKEQGLDSVEQKETKEPEANEESVSLSVSETLSNVNQNELIGPTVEQGADVANVTQPNKDLEKQNYASENIEETEASTNPNQTNLKISDSINDQHIESSDHHSDSLNTVTESLIPSTNHPTGVELVEDKYQSLEGKSAVSADTSTKVDDQDKVDENSNKNDHDTQHSGDNSNDNGSGPIDSFSEIQLQSNNAESSGQVGLNNELSSPSLDANSGSNSIQVSEAEKVIQPMDVGSGSTKSEDLIKNDHSPEIDDKISVLKEEALPDEKISSNEVAHEQKASSDDLETDLEPSKNDNLTNSTKQNEGNGITSTTTSTNDVSFKGNK